MNIMCFTVHNLIQAQCFRNKKKCLFWYSLNSFEINNLIAINDEMKNLIVHYKT